MFRARRALGSRHASAAADAGGPDAPSAGRRPRPAPSLRSIAIGLLARREYGRIELAERLRARGGEETQVAATLDELVALGLLSDARFAEALVQSRRGRYSRRAIAHALKDRQIAPDAAQAALVPLAANDEGAEAMALWQRRFGTPPKDPREKARHLRFLQSRGYSLSVALQVLREAGAAASADDLQPD